MKGDSRIGVIIPERLAKVGLEFVFVGASSDCEKCPLYKYCVGRLKHRHRYKVVDVIERSPGMGVTILASKCLLTNEPVKSVMLETKEFEINIDKDRAIPNMTFHFDREGCTNYTCPQREYCNYYGIPKGAKIEVVKVLDEEIECPKGKPLKRVIIRIREE